MSHTCLDPRRVREQGISPDLSHVAHMNQSRHTHEFMLSQLCLDPRRMPRATRTPRLGSCHTNASVTAHICVSAVRPVCRSAEIARATHLSRNSPRETLRRRPRAQHFAALAS